MATPKTIVLKVNDVNANYMPTTERQAGEIVTPGDLVKVASTGKWGHQANTERWNGWVVVESEYALEASTTAIDDTYAADETCFAVFPQSGDLLYLWITDGEAIAVGDLLVMANDTGKLVERTTEDLSLVIGVAESAISPSGSNGRCKVRIL